MASVLVTGSNRGLGFEWVRQYAAEGWRVYATCRHPAEAWDLHEVASKQTNVSIHRLDVTKPDEVNAVAVELLNESVDIVINNAGVYFEKYAPVGLKKLRYEDWEYAFRVNTMGAVRLSEAFLGHLPGARNAWLSLSAPTWEASPIYKVRGTTITDRAKQRSMPL